MTHIKHLTQLQTLLKRRISAFQCLLTHGLTHNSQVVSIRYLHASQSLIQQQKEESHEKQIGQVRPESGQLTLGEKGTYRYFFPQCRSAHVFWVLYGWHSKSSVSFPVVQGGKDVTYLGFVILAVGIAGTHRYYVVSAQQTYLFMAVWSDSNLYAERYVLQSYRI